MRKFLMASIFLSVFLSVLTAEQVVETSDLLTSGTQMSAEVPVYMALQSIDYFEAGFITQPFDGTASPVLSNEAVSLTLGEGGYASGFVYVYWVYATSDKVGINISLSSLKSEQHPGTGIDWQVEFSEGTVHSEAEPVQLVALNYAGERFLSGFKGDELLSIRTRTSESVDGKPADSYEGTITLEIVSLGQ